MKMSDVESQPLLVALTVALVRQGHRLEQDDFGDEATAGCAFFFSPLFFFPPISRPLLNCILPPNLSLEGAALLTLSISKVVGIQFCAVKLKKKAQKIINKMFSETR